MRILRTDDYKKVRLIKIAVLNSTVEMYYHKKLYTKEMVNY